MGLLLKSGAAKDSVRDYLIEIGRYPLLSAEEEILHARNVQAYRKCVEAKIKPTPEQKKLHDRSKATLITSNLRLVVDMAAPYAKANPHLMQDLIQDGSVGLNRAVELFNPELGWKFSTYAHWWIKQALTRYLKGSTRTIRLPMHVGETNQKIRRAYKQLHVKNGVQPSIEEIAKELELKPGQVADVLKFTQPIDSLDRVLKTDTDDGDTLLSMMAGDSADPSSIVDSEITKAKINEVLDCLPTRLGRIVKLSYGIGCDRAYSLNEIAVFEGCSRQAIGQLKAKALRELRKAHHSSKLKGLL